MQEGGQGALLGAACLQSLQLATPCEVLAGTCSFSGPSPTSSTLRSVLLTKRNTDHKIKLHVKGISTLASP